MKKIFMIFAFTALLCGSVFAQGNIRNRIAGTWIDHKGTTWVLSANGTVTGGRVYASENRTFSVREWNVTDSKIALKDEDDDLWIFDVSISSDAKTMIFSSNSALGGILLTKR